MNEGCVSKADERLRQTHTMTHLTFSRVSSDLHGIFGGGHYPHLQVTETFRDLKGLPRGKGSNRPP